MHYCEIEGTCRAALAGRARAAWSVVLAALLAAAMLVLAGCAGGANGGGAEAGLAGAGSGDSQKDAALQQQVRELRIASMKGPTSIGLASMMAEENGQFTVVASADEIAPLLAQGEVDIALVPANLASVLYGKTDGGIRVIDVNTLGVLWVVSGDASVDSVKALAGRTVYLTGKGTVPEYTLTALLQANGMSFEDVDVQFKSEPAEVAALLAQNPEAVGILPQPYATALTMKNAALKATVDLTEEWDAVFGEDGGSLVTGVTVVRTSLLEENPAVINAFLGNHAASAEVAVTEPASIVQTVVDLGIIENAALAEAAIPRCSTVCLTGLQMKMALSGYLAALYGQNPAAVGGSLPDDAFYYLADDSFSYLGAADASGAAGATE